MANRPSSRRKKKPKSQPQADGSLQTGRNTDQANDPDPILARLKELGGPVTRDRYLGLACVGTCKKEDWSAEDEADLPEELQDWSRFKK